MLGRIGFAIVFCLLLAAIGVYFAGGRRLIYLQLTNPKAARWEREWRGKNDYIADHRLLFQPYTPVTTLTPAEQEQLKAETSKFLGQMIQSYGKSAPLVAVCENNLSGVGLGKTTCMAMGEVFAISNPRADDPRFQREAKAFAETAKGAGFKAVIISGQGSDHTWY
jgi:hypothetical protein